MKKLIIFSIGLIILDQLTKYLVYFLYDSLSNVVIIPFLLEIGFLMNYGATYGLFSDFPVVLIVLPILAVLAMGYILFKYKSKLNKVEVLSLIFILSGAIGNLLDRIILGGVIDFIEMPFIGSILSIFNIGNYYNNLADIYCFTGLVLLVVSLFLPKPKELSDNKSIDVLLSTEESEEKDED
jgi:signal peptidase II